MTAHRVFVLYIASGAAAAAALDPGQAEFEARVKTYTKMVDRLDRGLGKLPDRAAAEEVHSHKEALATAIRQARPNAKQGDIFQPADRERIVRIVREATLGRAGAAARKAIAEDSPKAVVLAPNASYPEGAPLSTVPPALLLKLPALPDTVDYRFVGKALVLRDTRAGIIVDYIPNALP